MTIHARKTTATFTPRDDNDMFFDDVKTLYDLEAPEAGRVKVEQTYSDYRKGATRAARYAREPAAAESAGRSISTPASRSRPRRTAPRRSSSSRCRSSTTSRARTSRSPASSGNRLSAAGDELVFDRALHGLRNTIMLPAGWEVSALSQSGTIGTYEGRTFVALINLNGENTYRLTLRARKRTISDAATGAGARARDRAPPAVNAGECVVVAPLNGGEAIAGGDECARRTLPASTFKVPHALVALQTTSSTARR